MLFKARASVQCIRNISHKGTSYNLSALENIGKQAYAVAQY